MWSRRRFLSTVAAGVAVPAGIRAWPEPQDEIKTALNGPVGLQMWSLREYLPKDLAGTLKKVRAMGFRDVEGAGLWKHTAGELRAALDSAGLRCQSAHVQFDQLRDDAPGAFAEAKGLRSSTIFLRYCVRNALLPQATGLALALGQIVSGAVLVEVIFGYPGIGTVLFQAIRENDHFLIQGIVFTVIIALGFATLLLDALYPLLDPRISYRKA